MKHTILFAALACAVGFAAAKLPPPDDATKAKAAEAAAKAAWQAKVDGYQLCKAQDRVAAAYAKTKGMGASGKDAKAQVNKAGAAPTPAAVTASIAAAAATPAAATPAAAASGTPAPTVAAMVPPPPCTEPGPFAYNAPEQKPLETAGAHSPTGTAASPPSVKAQSAEMAPAKK